MGRGSYFGGCTIISTWSTGWSGERLARRKVTAEEKKQSAMLSAKAKEKASNKMAASAANLEERKRRAALKSRPTPRGNPKDIQERLNRHMVNVEVIRRGASTLPIRRIENRP